MFGKDKTIIGIITIRQLLNYLGSYKLKNEDKIAKAVLKDYKQLHLNQPIIYLTKAFTRHNYVIIKGEDDYYICDPKTLLTCIIAKN